MKNSLKILTVVYDLDVGGTQRAAQNFAIAYQKFGHDSRMLTLYQLGVREKDLKDNNVFVYPAFVVDKNCVNEINSWQPDIVHIHRSGESEAIYSDLFNLLPQDQIIVETNVFSFVDDSADVARIKAHFHLSRWCLWKWNHFSSKKSLGLVIPYLVLDENFYSVKNSKEVNEFKEKHRIPQNCFLFGRIGQKSPAKFHPDIFRCFEKLARARNNIHLFLVGTPDRYMNELLSTQAFNENKITILERINGDDELRVAYSAFDCFLHISSIGESFGMVLAESQLCETPVLTLSTPKVDNSQLEVCPHLTTSIVAKDVNAYYEEMRKLVDNRYDLKLLGARGREHIKKNYSPSVLIPQLNAIFKILIDKDSIADKLNQITLTNKTHVNIDDLKIMGSGQYALSIRLFFISPFIYLHLSTFLNRIKKWMAKLK